jgi:hypothetical protein
MRSIMTMRVKPDTGEVGLKQQFRVTNWSEYDRALVNRGNLTIWFDEASIRDQWTPPPPVGRGKPGLYSVTYLGMPRSDRVGQIASAALSSAGKRGSDAEISQPSQMVY